MYYDYPNFGADWTNVTEMDNRLRRGFIEFTTNETVVQQQFYRDMFIILSFRTEEPLGASRDAETQLDRVLETTNGDLSRLLSHEHFGNRLGAPIGGFFFH
uniref:Peptidase_M16 domain-containing protein n=2 Tax=Bursaphelenchus xylophilus TaxID=6326 RepID=A0A1I7SJK7_BURXY